MQKGQAPPLIKIHGGAYQRGLQHGRACGDLIGRYVDVLLSVARHEGQWRGLGALRAAPTREDILASALSFVPSMTAFAPKLIEEVHGIADGARLPFAEALLVNVRAEVMGLPTVDAMCTAFAVSRKSTANAAIMSGQNLDQHPANRELLTVLSIEPDYGPAMLMCSFAGLVGYPGINDAGISVFQNALSTPTWRASGMPHYFLKRALLEQVDMAGCRATIDRATVCSSSNYLVTDRAGAIRDFEVTPDRVAILDRGDDVFVHTNHFQSPSLVENEALLQLIPDSARRAPRMEALLARKLGRLTVEDLQDALADHDDAPTGICRHEPEVETIASIVAEPEQGRLHVAAGPACAARFLTYSL